jgi:hypothetical protein
VRSRPWNSHGFIDPFILFDNYHYTPSKDSSGAPENKAFNDKLKEKRPSLALISVEGIFIYSMHDILTSTTPILEELPLQSGGWSIPSGAPTTQPPAYLVQPYAHYPIDWLTSDDTIEWLGSSSLLCRTDHIAVVTLRTLQDDFLPTVKWYRTVMMKSAPFLSSMISPFIMDEHAQNDHARFCVVVKRDKPKRDVIYVYSLLSIRHAFIRRQSTKISTPAVVTLDSSSASSWSTNDNDHMIEHGMVTSIPLTNDAFEMDIEWINCEMLQVAHRDSGDIIIYHIPLFRTSSGSPSSSPLPPTILYRLEFGSSLQRIEPIPFMLNHDAIDATIEWITTTLMSSSAAAWSSPDLIAIVLSYLI